MKRLSDFLAPILLLGLAGLSFGQWQVNPQVQTQVGPVYPTRPDPYSFRATPPNYNPFQFNWHTGRWDYVPIPYDQPRPGVGPGPYLFNWNSGRWEYAPMTMMPGASVDNPSAAPSAAPPSAAPPSPAYPSPTGAAPAPGAVAPSAPAAGQHERDDARLWKPPATQPVRESPPAEFQGRLIGIRAIDLAGEPTAHLLLRLANAAGGHATVDIGDRLDLPANFNAGSDAQIVATGRLGDIDGTPVIFAHRLKIGSQTLEVNGRSAATR